MKTAAVLIALLSALVVPAAHAQTACSLLGEQQLLAQFPDNAPTASIIPRYIRNFVCSTSLALPIPNIAALRRSVIPASSIQLLGYYAAADPGAGPFNYNPLDTTSADNGGTIIVDAAGHRWYRQYVQPASVKFFGATGSTFTTTASGSGTTISLGNLGDFAAGQGIRIPQGGGAPAVGVPTGLTVASIQKASFTGTISGTTLTASAVTGNIVPGSIIATGASAGTTIVSLQPGTGGQAGTYTISPSQTVGSPTAMTTVPGATQYCYRVAAFTRGEGIGVASSQVCASNGAATLGLPFDTMAPAAGMVPSWSAVAGADGYVIYGNQTGAETAIATVDVTQLTFTDYGHVQAVPPWIPALPLSVAQPERVIATITSVNAINNTVTVPPTLVSFSNVTVTHDDTATLANAWATGLPLSVDTGTYNISTTLTASVNNQTIAGQNWMASVIHAYGCLDILTWSSRKSDANDLGLDANNDACGNGLNVTTGANNHFARLLFLNPYNTVSATAYNYLEMSDFLAQTDHRGQYVFHLFNGSATDNTLLATIKHFQSANSWSAIGIHIDGNVASTLVIDNTAIQSMRTEVLIDNAINAPDAPTFFKGEDLALNNCDDLCFRVAQGTQQIYLYRSYMQGRAGNLSPLVSTDTTVSNVNLFGGDFFGADQGGIVLHSLLNNIDNVNARGNSVTVGAFPDIFVPSDSIGTTITGGSNLTPNANSNVQTQSTAFIDIKSGATHVQITSGSAIGRSGCGIINEASPANDILIGGQSKGSPADSVDATTSGDTLDTGRFPGMYAATGSLQAKVCRSGPTGATIDTTDTAANILAANPGYVSGSTFDFLLSSAINASLTLNGGTGVTMAAGTNIVAPSGGAGNNSRVLFHCLVQTGGTTIFCSGTPS